MSVALHRPVATRIGLASTLARRRVHRRPIVAAVRAALAVVVVSALMAIILRAGPVDAVVETIIFGLAAILYALADFASELPVGPSADDSLT